MKKLFIICMYTAFLVSACETGTDEVSPDYLALAVEEISDNQQLLGNVYEETAKRVTKDTIQYVKKKSASLEEFVQYMSRITDGLFEDVIKSQDESAFDYFVKIPGVPGDSEDSAFLKLLELKDPLTGYARLIADDAKSISQQQEAWIILEAYKGPTGMVHRLPEASVSVNYEQIMAMIEMQGILTSSAMSDKEQEQAVEELVVQAQIPEVLIGLLLPAVQKYSDEPANDPFLSWLDTEVGPEINGGLNRDIIRRKAFMSFLGGLNLFVQEGYNNENQHSASINLMQARYETMLMSIWAEIWVQ